MFRYAWISTMLLSILAGCSTNGSSRVGASESGPDARPVRVRSSSDQEVGAANYDVKAGTCSAGSTQLISREQFAALTDGWRVASNDADCSDIKKDVLPRRTGYPEPFAKLQLSGSADVLVRVEEDGTVESAQAVCVTDSAFGEAAESTALQMKFVPRTCSGQPVRGAIMLPLSYDWK